MAVRIRRHQQRGNNARYYGGYCYVPVLRRPGYVKCNQHRVLQCPAKGHFVGEELVLTNQGHPKHNHDAEHQRDETPPFRAALRAATIRSSESLRTIYDQVTAMFPMMIREAPFELMERKMRYWRQREGPDHIVSPSYQHFYDLLMSEQWSNKKRFDNGELNVTLHVADGDQAALSFVEPTLATMLGISPTFYIQTICGMLTRVGNTKVLHIVTAIIHNHSFPLMVVLVNDVGQDEIYLRIMEKLKEVIPEPPVIFCDGRDQLLYTKLQQTYPDAVIMTSAYCFSASLVSSCGDHEIDLREPSAFALLTNLMALTTVCVDDIALRLDTIVNELLPRERELYNPLITHVRQWIAIPGVSNFSGFGYSESFDDPEKATLNVFLNHVTARSTQWNVLGYMAKVFSAGLRVMEALSQNQRGHSDLIPLVRSVGKDRRDILRYLYRRNLSPRERRICAQDLLQTLCRNLIFTVVRDRPLFLGERGIQQLVLNLGADDNEGLENNRAEAVVDEAGAEQQVQDIAARDVDIERHIAPVANVIDHEGAAVLIHDLARIAATRENNRVIGRICEICDTDPIAVNLNPCQHLILCFSCTTILLENVPRAGSFRCPRCRTNVESLSYPFFPDIRVTAG